MKSKKLLLGSLSAMALVATPIAAVVSCGKKDGEGDAGKAKKADAFNAADLIKKIGKDDKGFAVTLKNYGVWYVSAADAATKTTFKIQGKKLELPVITKSLTGGKATLYKTEAELLKEQNTAKDTATKAGKTAAEIVAAVEAVKKTNELQITAVAAPTEGQFVIIKHFIAADISNAETALGDALKTVNDQGIYKFDFTAESKKTATPALTDASKKAFEKIFTDLGLSVHITFAKTTAQVGTPAVSVDTITPTINLSVPSTDADAEALKNALSNGSGGALATADVTVNHGLTNTPRTQPIVIKAKGTAMTATELWKAINDAVKGGGAGITTKGTVADSLIKKDFEITLNIVAPTGTAGNMVNGMGSLTITASTGHSYNRTITLTTA